MKCFLERIGFRYCSSKEIEAEKRLLYLRAKLSEINNLKEISVNVIKMYNQGLSLHKISRLVRINRTTLRRWVKHRETKIRAYTFPSYKEWLKKEQI